MRRLFPIAAVGLLACLAAGPIRAATLETDSHVYPVTSKHRVEIEFPVGALRVVPTDESKVRFDIRVTCRGRSEERCQEMADRLTLDSHDSGGTLHLKLDHYPKWRSNGFKLAGELRVPRSLALRVDMGVGELVIEGLEGDLDVDLGVGEADVRAPRSGARRVEVEAGIGDASIRGAGSSIETSRFVGARATWSRGDGRSDVRLHVGVGEATVRLE
jgi:hypothetical protein